MFAAFRQTWVGGSAGRTWRVTPTWQTLQIHSDLLFIVFVSFLTTGVTVSSPVCVEIRVRFVIQMSFTALVLVLIMVSAPINGVLAVFFLCTCL